jgi:mRNA-degrading endonuclease RelE of RelBE toxin-antitoxin system
VRDPLFDILISNRARRSLRRLPQDYARRAILAFEALKQNPAPVPEYEVKKLSGLKDTCRKHGKKAHDL